MSAVRSIHTHSSNRSSTSQLMASLVAIVSITLIVGVSPAQAMNWGAWRGVGGKAVGPITAVARDTDHVELFFTGPDGYLRNATLTPPNGRTSWSFVNGRAASGSAVTAIVRDRTHIQL